MGELLYCRNRGTTSCCFVEEKCGRDFVAINDEMTQQAVDFMQKPQSFVSNLVENAGYDSCHRTKGSLHISTIIGKFLLCFPQEYDAKQCHLDCEKQEKSGFAKECREGGGVFKCCIR